MYANHVAGEYGPQTVELHIATAERLALPPEADNALYDRGTLISPALIDEKTINEVWHLSHADALAIEEIIDLAG